MISGNINSTYFSVYNCGEMIVADPVYYVSWTPSYVSSGLFTLDGRSHWIGDYSGYFEFSTGIIDNYAFESISINSFETNAYSIGLAAFRHCNVLSEVNLPECLYISNLAFAITSLRTISLPKCSYIGTSAFSACTRLSEISLPECTYIGSSAFEQTGLTILTLPGSSVCTLANLYALYDTPIASSHGGVYVPSSLVSIYKSATNWSWWSNNIYPIPE